MTHDDRNSTDGPRESLTDDATQWKTARAMLDSHADSVDELTRARLKAARLRALDSRAVARIPAWIIPAGAVAAGALIVVTLNSRTPDTMVSKSEPLPDAEALYFAADDIDLAEDLEFIEWLAMEPGEKTG